MAESYRGLTIRIGGDTTGLQKALKTSTSAIQGADMELRKLGQALKLDPGNVEAFNLQVGYLGDKATSTAMKLYQMQQAAEQIRGKKMEFFNVETGKEELKVIGEIRKETENVHLQAEKATASYNRVRDELHGLYDNLTKYNQQAVDGAIGGQLDNLKEKLENALTLDSKSIATAVDTTITQIKGKFDSLEGIIVKPESFDAMAERLKKYAETYSSIEDEAEKNTVAEAFKIVAQDITTATAQVINFDSAWTTPEKLKELKKQLSGISGALELDPSKIDAFFDKIFEYKDKYKSAEDTLQIQNEVARLADLEVEIERAKSSVTDLAKALASMDVPSELMRSMNDLTEKADAYKKAVSESMSRANTAVGEYKLNGDDATRNAAMNEYANAIKNAKSQLETLNEQMNKFNPEEVKRWSGMTETATQQLVKASVVHAQATKDVKTYEGAVEGALEVLTRLENTAGGEIKILDTDEVAEVLNAVNHFRDELLAFDEANEQASESVKEDLVAALEKLKEAAEAAGETDLAEYFANTIKSVDKMKDNFRGLAEAEKILEGTEGQLQEALRRKDWEGRRNEVMAAKKAIDEATVAEQKFAAGDFKMDTKWIEDLKSVKSDLESVGSSVAQEFQQATASISALGGVTDTATTKAKALIDAFASDMGNTDALRLGLDSLNEAFVASNTKAEMLRDTLSKYTSDKIDETAIATGRVGTNAAQAKAEVDDALQKLSEATARLKELETAKEKALSVKTSDTELEQLETEIAEATQEWERCGTAAEIALKKLDTAKATQEFVKLRQELAMTDADVEKLSNDAKAIAESLATGGAESFAKRVFDDMDAAIDGAKGALDDAIDRFTKLSGAMETLHGKSAAAAQQQSAMGEVLSAASAYVQKLSQSYENLSESISPERVVELKKQYGDLGTASEQTSEKVRLLAQSLVTANTAGDAEEVKRLTDELIKATEAANEVATALKLEGLGDSMVTSVAEVKEKLKEAFGSDISGMFRSMFAELDDSKGVFEAATTRLSALTKATETLKDNARIAAMQQEALGDAANAGSAYEKQLADALELVSKYITPERVRELKDEYGDLGTAAHETAKKVEDLANEILEAALAGDEDGMKGLIAQYKDLKAAATEAAAALAQQDISDRSVKVLTDQAEAAKKSASGSEAAFQQAAQRMSQYAERAASKIVESANTVDLAYRNMRKTVDGTEEQFRTLHDEAIKFSQTNFVSADTMLQMESLGGQLGIVVERLEDFGTVAANLDIATDIDAETVALQLGQITNVMSDLDDTTFENVADALVRLGNNTATTESRIMNVAERMMAIANVTSMTTPQLLAWSAAIASTGQRSESAATAINNSITGIGQAVAEGGDTLQQFANIAGMSAEEFSEKWKSSSSEALEAFVKGLGNLTDNSTDAIAALDSVGISSVRQETALLALSQTIDNLDNSLQLAEDGFNGGGDAAREAAQKSEGFSGALQILKNNVDALAESFGDALVPFINLASDALKIIYNVVSIIPDPLKSVAAALTAIAVAAATIGPTVDKFLKGSVIADMTTNVTTVLERVKEFGPVLSKILDKLGPIGTILGDTGSKLSSLAKAMLDVKTAESAAAAGANVLSAALEAIPYVAWVVGAVKAFTMLSDMIGEAINRTELINEATVKLESAYNNLGSSYSEVMGGMKESLEQIKDENNELLESMVTFADNVSETWSNLGSDFAMVDTYVDTIERLGNQGHVTGGELEILKNAVKEYNNLTGASIQVTNDYTGELNLSTKAILDMADSYKKLAEAEAYQQLLSDTVRKRIELQREQAEAQEKLNDLTEKYGIDLGNGYTFMLAFTDEGRAYEQRISDISAELAQLDKLQDEYSQHLSSSTTYVKDYSTAVVETGGSLSEFNKLTDEQKAKINEIQATLVGTGDSLTNYGSLTKEQLIAIINNWDETADSVKKTLEDMANAANEAAEEAEDAAQKAIEAQQRANSHAYDALKRELDHQYDTEKDSRDKTYEMKKREYDNEYDLLKKELDHQYDAEKDKQDKTYNAQKKAYDREYDKLKDKYDKEYTLAKRAYDEEYDALKTSLDREYDALKDAYDEEYDLRKQALDDQYNAVKDSYDKQVDALKDSLDEQYNSLKDSLDKQYDALKDSLDKQYDEVKKSLDSVYDAYKDELDDQYDLRKTALDKEYNALKTTLDKEKEARKKELDAEVEDVKESLDDAYEVRKKALDKEYKAYQKASQKYLKQFKKEQTAQVDAFKKATDARVSELKRELEAQQAIIDAETKRKTNAIDERIAALKGETDAENREKKERERAEKTAELQNAVDTAKSRRTRAEAEKELNDYLREIAMEDAQERREQLISELEDERGAIEEDGKERKDQLDGQYNAEIEALKESRALELEVLQEYLDEKYEVEQEAEAARLEKIKENQTAELEAIKERHAAEIEAMKERNTLELETIAEQNALKLETMKANHDAELEVLKEQNDAKLAAMKEQHDAELEAIKEQNEARLEAVKEQNEAQLSALKEANEAQVNAAKDANEASLLELKRANDEELKELKKWQGEQLQAVKDSNDLILQQKKYEHEDALQALKDSQGFELQALKDGQDQQLQYLKDNQEAWLTTIKENNEGILNQKKLDNADALQALKDDQALELRTIKEGHEDQLTALKEHNEDIIKEMKENKEKVKTEADGTKDAVTGAAKDANAGVTKESSEAKKTLLDDIYDVSDIFPKESSKTKKSLLDDLNEATDIIPKKSCETKKSLIDDLDETNKSGTQSMEELAENTKSSWDEGAQHVISKSGEKKNKLIADLDEEEKKFSSTGDNINKTTKSNVKDYTDTVSDGMDTAKTDVEDGVGDMEDAIGDADLAGSIQGPLGELKNVLSNLDTYSWGSDMMQNFGKGMESAIGYVSSVAQTVASNVSSWMGHSVPEKGEWHEGGKGEVVWGQDLMDNFIEGIVSREQALADALEGLAEVVEEKFDPSLPIDELERYVAYAKTAYNAQEGDLNRHAANVEEQYAVMFDVMRRRLGEFAEVYVMNDREMYAKSLALLNEHVDRTYEEHADMYDRLASYTERYVDSIAAAYEAIDDITRGNIDRQVQVSVQGQSAQPVINVNVTLSDVTIRETADIDKLAQQLAKRVDQVTRSRIGR